MKVYKKENRWWEEPEKSYNDFDTDISEQVDSILKSNLSKKEIFKKISNLIGYIYPNCDSLNSSKLPPELVGNICKESSNRGFEEYVESIEKNLKKKYREEAIYDIII